MMRESLCYLLLGSVSGVTPSFCLVCFKVQLAYIKVLKHFAYEQFAFRLRPSFQIFELLLATGSSISSHFC